MKLAVMTVGLGFGDEGKGATVDALVRRLGATLVVRYNGGAQAGHNVVLPDGRHHCFAQYGAGTFAGARTYLGPRVLFDPLALAAEARHLTQVGVIGPPIVLVDERAPVLTPWHRAVNRLREAARGDARHGTCGVGIGELASDLVDGRTVIRAGDLVPGPRWRERLREIARAVYAEQVGKVPAISTSPPAEVYDDAFGALAVVPDRWVERVHDEVVNRLIHLVDGMPPGHDAVVFEGAQGVLLDETHGFHPHTTWSDCTLANAEEILAAAGGAATVVRLGVTRTYHTRHGAGPLPTELTYSRDDIHLAERGGPGWVLMQGEHNGTGEWQGRFRVGWFDMELCAYALRACPVDALAITCTDREPHASGFWVANWRYTGAGAADWYDHHADLSAYELAERRGVALRSVVPQYRIADPIAAIHATAGVPVAGFSSGPTHEHRKWTPSFDVLVEGRLAGTRG